jgi:hypothetical protein
MRTWTDWTDMQRGRAVELLDNLFDAARQHNIHSKDLAAAALCHFSPALRSVWLCLLPTPVLRPPCEQGVASFGHDEVIVSQLPGFFAALGEGAQCDSLRDSRAQYQASFHLGVQGRPAWPSGPSVCGCCAFLMNAAWLACV